MIELYFLFYGIIIGAIFIMLFDPKPNRKEQGILRKLPEKCPLCGDMIKNIPAGTSKRTKQPYREFWVCENNDCSFTCNKKNGYYICNFEKSKSKNGRQNNEKSKTRTLENKKEEVQDTDEIDVSKIPF